MKAEIDKIHSQNKSYDNQIDKCLEDIEELYQTTEYLERDKYSVNEHKEDKRESDELMYRMHTVMDYFSNEFLRL